MNRETAAKGDQTTVLGWHRGEGGLLVGEAERVGVDLSYVSVKLMLFLLATNIKRIRFWKLTAGAHH